MSDDPNDSFDGSEAGRALQRSMVRFLIENEVVDDPTVKAAILVNIYNTSPLIVDAEFLTDTFERRMLVWLRLKPWVKLFGKHRDVASAVLDVLSQALPRFEFRVTLDRKLFDLAVKRGAEVAIRRTGRGNAPPQGAPDAAK